MSTQIGFTPPEPPRKWKFVWDGQPGMIVETIADDKVYFYAWIPDNGTVKIGIMQSETRQSNEDVEAKALRRAG